MDISQIIEGNGKSIGLTTFSAYLAIALTVLESNQASTYV